MNPFVVDPDWGWWIVFYFFLGGIAAGAYFTSSLIEMVGDERDREVSRVGYWIAFPLVSVCGVLLILDLHRPERFWHMILKSEVAEAAIDEGWPWSGDGWGLMVQAPSMKFWSPMSIGSWALLLFGLCSFLSFLGSLRSTGKMTRWLRQGALGKGLQWIGSFVGFFVAAYTGALLTATNQPLWSDSVWIAALFLTSAASTGLAMMILLAHWRRRIADDTREKLERADRIIIVLELITFSLFVISVATWFVPIISLTSGKLLLGGTLLLGIVLPLGLQLWFRRAGKQQREAHTHALAATAIALVGGFVLRYAILMTPPELLKHPPESTAQKCETPAAPDWLPRLSPEDGRGAGEPGADPQNRVGTVRPRSKVFVENRDE
jgi:formate-dependent nitrite reductase membrane component NrfD